MNLERGGARCYMTARTPEDRCYFKSKIYQRKFRAQKMRELWGKILPNPDEDEPPREQPFEDLPLFFEEGAGGAFCQVADEKQWRKTKNVHGQGLVAQVEWQALPTQGRYSGIYWSGSDTVIMRLSDVNFLYEGAEGHTPAAAFKFLIDKGESMNLLAQYDLLPFDSWNFFDEPITTRVLNKGDDDLNGENEAINIMMDTVVRKMVEGSARPFATGLSHVADKRNNGQRIPHAKVKTPYELLFIAPDEIRERFDDERPEKPWY